MSKKTTWLRIAATAVCLTIATVAPGPSFGAPIDAAGMDSSGAAEPSSTVVGRTDDGSGRDRQATTGGPGGLTAPSLPQDPQPAGALTLPDGYADRVDANLRKPTDSWGEQLMALPNGPTLDNVRPLLTPANHSGSSVSLSPWYYLPLTYPAPDLRTWAADRAFSLHVGDGSEIQSHWIGDPDAQRVGFYVGVDGQERFGAAESRLSTPTLDDGYLPILGNTYTDAQGVEYTRESFTTRLADDGELVSLVRFTVKRPNAHVSEVKLRMAVAGSQVDSMTGDDHAVKIGEKHVLISSAPGTWSGTDFTADLQLSGGETEVYVLVANSPTNLGDLIPSAAWYDEQRTAIADNWRDLVAGGATIDIPEKYAADAMRSMVLNNLVMGFNLTVGNGYEGQDTSFAFIPEVIATLTSIGDYGYDARAKETLEEFLKRGQGVFLTWERGIKLQAVARHYMQTGDESIIESNLDTFTSWLADIQAQRDNDPNGLLEKTRYASDIVTPVHGIHHQTDAWRGMRDIGVALEQMGLAEPAESFRTEAQELRSSVLEAIDRSKTVLPDGSIFVPIALLSDFDDEPHDSVTDSFLGSYWNLIMPYAMGSGLIEPGSELATGMEQYLNQHGGLLLGLTRFNLTSDPVGSCITATGGGWPDVPGYRSTGIDQQYGYSYAKFLADNGEADRLNMSFYGMLAHSFSPNTFIGGEGATVSPCGSEYHRSQYWAPLSPHNATYLKALRGMLVHETLDTDGRPVGLDIAPATARTWLEHGERVAVSDLPTLFGPLEFSIESKLRSNRITATINKPADRPMSGSLQEIRLHLRTPAGYELASATVNGRPASIDVEQSTVMIAGDSDTATVEARFRRVPIERVSHAIAAEASVSDRVVPSGSRTQLTTLVELSGTSSVQARVSYQVPEGWPSPPAETIKANSQGRITWESVTSTLTVPAGTESGNHQVQVIVTRPDGTRTQQAATVEVADSVPDGSYPDLVKAESPVAYWPLDEVAGTDAQDASGHDNNGTFTGTVRTGQPGPNPAAGSVRLDGGYVDVPDSPSLSLTGPYTLEAWTFSYGGGEQGIIEKYDTPARNGYLLRTGTDGSFEDRGYNRLQAMNLSDTLSATPFSGDFLAPGRWHHVVSVFDGETLTIYRDGVVVSETPMTRTPTDGTASLKIGARGDDAANRFDGWMSNVAVYDKALSAATVKRHYVKGMLG